jgi:hypothetical protein
VNFLELLVPLFESPYSLFELTNLFKHDYLFGLEVYFLLLQFFKVHQVFLDVDAISIVYAIFPLIGESLADLYGKQFSPQVLVFL